MPESRAPWVGEDGRPVLPTKALLVTEIEGAAFDSAQGYTLVTVRTKSETFTIACEPRTADRWIAALTQARARL